MRAVFMVNIAILVGQFCRELDLPPRGHFRTWCAGSRTSVQSGKQFETHRFVSTGLCVALPCAGMHSGTQIVHYGTNSAIRIRTTQFVYPWKECLPFSLASSTGMASVDGARRRLSEVYPSTISIIECICLSFPVKKVLWKRRS